MAIVKIGEDKLRQLQNYRGKYKLPTGSNLKQTVEIPKLINPAAQVTTSKVGTPMTAAQTVSSADRMAAAVRSALQNPGTDTMSDFIRDYNSQESNPFFIGQSTDGVVSVRHKTDYEALIEQAEKEQPDAWDAIAKATTKEEKTAAQNRVFEVNRLKEEQASVANQYYQLENELQRYNLLRDTDSGELYKSAAGEKDDIQKLSTVVANWGMMDDDTRNIMQEMMNKYGLTEADFYDEVGGIPNNKVKKLISSLSAGMEQKDRELGQAGYDFKRMEQYQDTLERAEEYEKRMADWERKAKEHPILSSVATVAAAPFQIFDFAGQALRSIGNNPADMEHYVAPDVYSMHVTNFVNQIRGTVSKEIEETVPWGNVVSFLYQTGMSIADSMSQVYTLGPTSLVFMGGAAASSTAADIIQRGGTSTQAFWGGLAAGAAEAVFEKVSIDNLLTARSTRKVRDILKGAAKQAGVEASEEMLTEISNIISDSIIMGEKGDYAQTVAAYEEQGMSREAAKRKALLDSIGQVALAGLGGLISGGVSGGTFRTAEMMQYRGSEVGQAESTISSINKTLQKAGVQDPTEFYESVGVENPYLEAMTPEGAEFLRGAAEAYADLKNAVAERAQTRQQESNTAEQGVKAPTESLLDRAVAEVRESGTLSNRTATEILNTPDAVRTLTDNGMVLKSGMTQSQRRAMVKAAVEREAAPDTVKQAMEDMGLIWAGNQQPMDETQSEPKTTRDIVYDRDIAYDGVNWAGSEPMTMEQAAPVTEKADTITEQEQPVTEQQKSQTVTRVQQPAGNNAIDGLEWEGSRQYAGVAQADTAVYTGNEPGAAQVQAQQAGNERMTENEGTEVPGRSAGRQLDERAGEQAGSSVEYDTGRSGPAADQSGAAARRQALGKTLAGEKVSSKSLGLENGTEEATLQVLPESSWDAALQETAKWVREELYKDIVFVLGPIEVDQGGKINRVRGVYTADRIIVRADHSNVTPEQIARHEEWHDITHRTPNLTREVHEKIVDTYGPEELDAMVQVYVKRMRGLLELPKNPTNEELERALRRAEEEIFADAYAGINAFGTKASQYRDTVQEYADRDQQQRRAQRQQETQRETGPPARYSMEDEPVIDWAGSEPISTEETRSEKITQEEIKSIQSIGRKSVNDFTSAEIAATSRFAQRYWKEMGAKSPFFRAWFGDWRAADTTPVQIADQIGDTRGVQRNEDTGWEINISSKVFNETKTHGNIPSVRARPFLQYINDIVKKAILLDSYTMAEGKTKSGNSLLMHSLYAVADQGNGPEIIKLYVEEMNNPNSANTTKRSYKLLNIESQQPGVKGSDRGPSLITQTADIESVADLFAAVKERDPDFHPREASKVINEDGTPKVVYHGTDAEFNRFQSQNGVYWFSENADYAEAMAEERGGGRIIEAYLNLRNPYRVKLKPGQFTDPAAEAPHIRKAKAEGYDGVIFTADTDNPLEQDTFYAAFRPDQIKSATDNVGTFDRSNEDIRYSMEDEELDTQEARDSVKEQLQKSYETDEQERQRKITSINRRLEKFSAQEYQEKLFHEGGLDAVKKNVAKIKRLYRQLAELEGTAGPRAKKGTAENQQTEKQPKVLPVQAHLAKQKFRNNMTDFFSIPQEQKKEIEYLLDDFAEHVIRYGRIDDQARDALFNRLYEAGVVQVEADQYLAKGREAVENGEVYVPQEVKEEFGDDWNEFRNRAFESGVMITDNEEAATINQWNAELATEFPGLFDADVFDHKTALERIVQVAEEGQDVNLSLAEYTAQMAEKSGVDVDVLLEAMEQKMDYQLRVLADSAKLEIKLRSRNEVRDALERERRKKLGEQKREQRKLRRLQNDTLKTLQWLKRNQRKAPEELRQSIKNVLGDLDLYAIGVANELNFSKKYGVTWEEIPALYEAAKNSGKIVKMPDLERIKERITATKIESLDMDTLQDLFQMARTLQHELENREKLIGEEQTKYFSDIHRDVKRELREGKGYTGKKLDKFFNKEQLSPVNFLLRMAGWNPESTWAKMVNQLVKGERDVRRYKVDALLPLQKFMRENKEWLERADGQGKNGIWYEMEVRPVQKIGLKGEPEYGDPVTISMTPMQKIQLWLESQNDDNLRHMMGGRTFVNKKLYQKGERKEAFNVGNKENTISLTPADVKRIVSDLTPQELELANLFKDYYNGYAKKEINRVSNILYGYDKAIGKNYAPIYTNQNYNNQTIGEFNATAEGVGSIKERVPEATNPSLNISALDAFERHVEATAKFVGMAVPVRNWKYMLNYSEGAQNVEKTWGAITNQWGEDAQKYIEDILVRLQNKQYDEQNSLEKIFNWMQRNSVAATFGANPNVTGKQLLGLLAAGVELNPKYLIGTNPFDLGKKRYDKQIIDIYTPERAYRGLGYATMETKQLKESQNWTQRGPKRKFLLGGGSLTAMDQVLTKYMWLWAENRVRHEFKDLDVGTQEQIQNGDSPFYQKVAEVFEQALYNSQPMADEMHNSPFRKSRNALVKTVTMFRSDAMVAYNLIRQKHGEARYYEKTGQPGKAKAAKIAAIGTLLAIILNAGLNELFDALNSLLKNGMKYYRDDEDELTAASIAEEVTSGMVASLMGTASVGGDTLAELILTTARGKSFFGLEAPGLEQVMDVAEMGKDAFTSFAQVAKDAASMDDVEGTWLENMKTYGERYGSELLGGALDLAGSISMAFAGVPADNVKAYVLGIMQQFSPKIKTEFESLAATMEKNYLNDATGEVLAIKVRKLLENRLGIDGDWELAAEEIARLYESDAESAKYAMFGNTPKEINDQKLTAGQKQVYDMAYRDLVRNALDELMESDSYLDADDEKKCKMLKALYDYADAMAREQVVPGSVELKTETGGLSSFGKADYLLESGVSLAEYIQLKSADAVDNAVKAVEAGEPVQRSTDVALMVSRVKEELPEDATKLQQQAAVFEAAKTAQEEMTAAVMVIDKDDMPKMEAVYAFGVTPETVTDFKERFEKVYGKDVSKSQERVEDIIDEMMGLSDEERAILWQMQDRGWKWSSNPYDRKTAREFLERAGWNEE